MSDRYERVNLIDWYSQEDLEGKQVAVVGCGAVGNELIKNLVLLGVGTIALYDIDVIETHNLTRSVLFSDGDVGNRKVDIAAQRARNLNSAVSIAAYHGDFWNTLTICSLEKCDVVFSCLDNFEARIKLANLCRLLGVNFVNTGIDSRFAVVEVFPFSSHSALACFECHVPPSVYQRLSKRYSCGWLKQLSFVERKIPTTIVTASIAGGMAASKGLRLGDASTPDGVTRVFVDSIAGHSTVSSMEKNPGCVVCSGSVGRASVLRPAWGNAPIKLSGVQADLSDLEVTLSDPLLVSARCQVCFNEDEYMKPVAQFDSNITWCQQCAANSVSVNIRDRFTAKELLDHFGNKPWPAKYAILDIADQLLLLDLEGEINERH